MMDGQNYIINRFNITKFHAALIRHLRLVFYTFKTDELTRYWEYIKSLYKSDTLIHYKDSPELYKFIKNACDEYIKEYIATDEYSCISVMLDQEGCTSWEVLDGLFDIGPITNVYVLVRSLLLYNLFIDDRIVGILERMCHRDYFEEDEYGRK